MEVTYQYIHLYVYSSIPMMLAVPFGEAYRLISAWEDYIGAKSVRSHIIIQCIQSGMEVAAHIDISKMVMIVLDPIEYILRDGALYVPED